MMGLLDHEQVQGHHTRAVPKSEPLLPQAQEVLELTAILARLPADTVVRRIDLTSFLDQPIYRIGLQNASHAQNASQLFDARSGQRFEITEHVASRIAQNDFTGDGKVTSIVAVQAPSIEIRKHRGAAWRVDFDDADATSLYVSTDDGAILERRNDTWRLFDVFWMLHIMDYQGRENFNNVLLIFASLIAAWFSVTGVVLFFDSFKKTDFLSILPDRWWRKRAKINVCAPHGEVVARIDTFTGGRLYDALAHAKIVLPSNCGGGGTCGLCVVALDSASPLSAADLRLIPPQQIREGVRLSCQAQVVADLSVTISNEVLSAKTATAEVVESRFLTPFIREITLRIGSAEFDYHAGSYVHVVIPPHELSGSDIEVSGEIHSACGMSDYTLQHTVKSEIRRAYSLATAPKEKCGMIVLNVRFMPPPPGRQGISSGIGSTYMWSLQKGDCIDVVGPLGDFRSRNTGRDMIVIGGGAGMAPLRSIIRDELLFKKSGRKIDFWYGGRTRKDLFYDTEFDELQSANPNFSWQPVLSEPTPEDDWRGPTGYVHIAVQKRLLSRMVIPESCEFYICGPPPMLSATRQMLAQLNVADSQVYFDDFGI